MFMFVGRVVVIVMMQMGMMPMLVLTVFMFVVVREVNVELDSFDARLLLPRGVQVIAVEFKLLQFVLKLMKIDTEINHRADKHIAADAAEDVEVKGDHCSSS